MRTGLDDPEKAIRAFESIHGLRVTVHDFSGSLTPGLHDQRSVHSHPLCRCVKLSGGERKCVEFEVVRLRADLHHCPDGRFHVCHAGFVEWILPVYNQLELEWVLFAGVRMPGRDITSVHREKLTRWSKSPWSRDTVMPPSVSQSEAEMILEHLRQLAARLHSWARAHSPAEVDRVPEGVVGHQVTQRRTLIRRLIETRQSADLRLKDVARELGVSEGRATHLIRECCGDSFRNMLVDVRLRTARELLRSSSLSILEVALCSGFNEISHFNRLFRKRVGTTPRQFRCAR